MSIRRGIFATMLAVASLGLSSCESGSSSSSRHGDGTKITSSASMSGMAGMRKMPGIGIGISRLDVSARTTTWLVRQKKAAVSPENVIQPEYRRPGIHEGILPHKSMAAKSVRERNTESSSALGLSSNSLRTRISDPVLANILTNSLCMSVASGRGFIAGLADTFIAVVDGTMREVLFDHLVIIANSVRGPEANDETIHVASAVSFKAQVADSIGGQQTSTNPNFVSDGKDASFTDSKSAPIAEAVTREQVTTLAGLREVAGSKDGIGIRASFSVPVGLALDAAGNAYVADFSDSVIRKITPAGVVTTAAGLAGSVGSSDGTAADARFDHPTTLAIDPAGNIYVSDSWNYTIRKITPAGEVTTVAGTALVKGSADGFGANASFSYPSGLALDANGNLYVADNGNNTIRKITPQGVVTTLAGASGATGSVDGRGANARFNHPTFLTLDEHGNIYVVDYRNNLIRKIDPAGMVSTVADLRTWPAANAGIGDQVGRETPSGVALDVTGNLYVGDWSSNIIRKVSKDGKVTTALHIPEQLGLDTDPKSRSGYVGGIAIWRDRLLFTSGHAVLEASY